MLRCETKVSRQSGCLMWREKGLGEKIWREGESRKLTRLLPLSLVLSFPFVLRRDGPCPAEPFISLHNVASQCFTFTQRDTSQSSRASWEFLHDSFHSVGKHERLGDMEGSSGDLNAI